jgi:cytochrome bd-I ubiquinol oxidase subunit X
MFDAGAMINARPTRARHDERMARCLAILTAAAHPLPLHDSNARPLRQPGRTANPTPLAWRRVLVHDRCKGLRRGRFGAADLPSVASHVRVAGRHAPCVAVRVAGPAIKETAMWYFTWILGVGVALAFGVINVMWLEANGKFARDPQPTDTPAVPSGDKSA